MTGPPLTSGEHDKQDVKSCIRTYQYQEAWNANTFLCTRSQNFFHLDFSINEVFKSINGNIERSVTGVALENPFNAVIWIADFLNKRGSELKKGQIVMTGSTFPTYFPQLDDVIEFEVFDIGKIKINVSR